MFRFLLRFWFCRFWLIFWIHQCLMKFQIHVFQWIWGVALIYLVGGWNAETDLGGGGRMPPFFCNHVFLCNHFKELQTVLIEVKPIINNVPLIYVYPNTIETCLRLNHLLFGRQLFYSPNARWTVVRSLTVLSSIKHYW